MTTANPFADDPDQAAIYEQEIDEIRQAVVFYCACHIKVTRQRDGYRITAPGYYATVGA